MMFLCCSIKNEICIISINGEICEYKLNCSNIGASSVSKVIRNRISVKYSN